MPLVALLSSGTTSAREYAAGALWHLALDKANQSSIARFNGISPLVTILDDGTSQAHKHASDALARLAIKNADNQAQISKHCVALLGNESTGTQQRAARVLQQLAAHNPLAGRDRQRGRHLAARDATLGGRAGRQGGGSPRSRRQPSTRPRPSSPSPPASSCS